MPLIIVLLIFISVALIIYGIARAVTGADKRRPRDGEPRVEVVYRVPSVFDRRNKK